MSRRTRNRRTGVTRDRYKQTAPRVKRVRTYREIEVIRRPAPYLPERRVVHRYAIQDPRIYDEGYLAHASKPLPKPPPIYPSPKRKALHPALIQSICRRRRIRKAVMFAKGIAGAGGALSRRVRSVRARNYRRNYKRVKC